MDEAGTGEHKTFRNVRGAASNAASVAEQVAVLLRMCAALGSRESNCLGDLGFSEGGQKSILGNQLVPIEYGHCFGN